MLEHSHIHKFILTMQMMEKVSQQPVQETEMIVADHFCECLCFPKHLALSSSPRHLMPTNGTHHKTQNLNNQLLTNLEENGSDLL